MSSHTETPDHLLRRRAAVEAMPPLRDVIAAHGLNAQKSLGQNFLLDLNVTDRIVRGAMDRAGDKSWAGVTAFEIGSGPGGLTRSLLKTDAAKVIAIEFDSRAVAALQDLKNAAMGDFEIIQQDALRADLCALSPAPRVIVANLPYNIATPLLIGWLKQIRENSQSYHSMTLMFQREVADRITAAPDRKAYGRLAVISQWLCQAVRIYDLPPSAFTPPPKVDSAVVHFIPKSQQEKMPPFAAVEKVTAAAFNQRRKMIRSSLKDYMPAIEALGIDPQKRAENLTVQQYLDIASYNSSDMGCV